jgi:hypothetical protein
MVSFVDEPFSPFGDIFSYLRESRLCYDVLYVKFIFSVNRTSLMGNYLPEMFSEMWEPVRDFAYLKLPSAGLQSIAALST